MYNVTCPACGEAIKVPSGPHTVVTTPARRDMPSGISVDGKSVHRCDPDTPVSTP